MANSDDNEMQTGRSAALRERMVREQLIRRGIRCPKTLEAMRHVPREAFMPEYDAEHAYADGAAPIRCGQTISQPYMVAYMTELLELRDADRVLEVGTGSGYQTAVLARIAREVYTVEMYPELAEAARERLDRLGIENVRQLCGDGTLGWAEEAPFNGIIVTAGAPQVPSSLRAQLADGGRLVLPVGSEVGQTLVRVWRVGEGFRREDLLRCRFVKLVGAEGWKVL